MPERTFLAGPRGGVFFQGDNRGWWVGGHDVNDDAVGREEEEEEEKEEEEERKPSVIAPHLSSSDYVGSSCRHERLHLISFLVFPQFCVWSRTLTVSEDIQTLFLMSDFNKLLPQFCRNF